MSRPFHPRGLTRGAGLLLVALALIVPEVAAAQLLPRGQRPQRRAQEADLPPVAAILVARGGYDLEFQEFVLGGLARLALPLPLKPTLQAGGDFTFFQGLTDRGATVDVLLSPLQGLLVGGGPAWRSSIFPGERDEGRTTRPGYSFVVLLGGLPGRGRPGAGGASRLVTGLSYRWMDFDGYQPQQITLEVGWRLGG